MDAGIKASNSGTAMRTLLTNLTAPTSNAAGAIEDYAIQVTYASDGSLDLNATLISLRSSLKSLPLAEQAEAAKALAGKTGMAGLLAIVNATDERFNELTDTINNSTETISYFNENVLASGKVGDEAVNTINMMKEAYSGAEASAAGLNLTTQDLALAVQVLGADSKVTSSNVEDLLNVFNAMKSPTEKNAKIMKALGLTYREINDEAFDYNKTCSMIDSSIGKLNQSQKEQVKTQLDASMTLEEANKVLEKYDLTAKSASTGQIDMISNLEQLRNKFSIMDEATRKATLEQMGLSSAIEEVNEICAMSDEDFKLYCDNLELATGLADKMATAMDETTKNGLLSLASALSDVGIDAFERFKVTLNEATGSLNKFFETWRNEQNGEFNYSFDSFKLAMNGLLEDVRNMDLAGAMGTAISNMNNFIINDGLSSVLAIGGEIISQICKGIIDNQTEIEIGISSAIYQIATWVQANASQIGDAGRIIINAISKGIQDNKTEIHGALDAVAGAMNSWIEGSEQIKSLTGNFADIFIDSFIQNTTDKVTGKGSEIWNAITSGLMNSQPDMSKGGTGLIKNITDWLFGESYADEVTEGAKPLGAGIANGAKQGLDENKDGLKQSAKGMGDGAVEGAKEGLAPLGEIMMLNEATAALQQSATNMYNGAKVSFSKLSDVARESFVSLYNVINNQMTNATNAVRTGFVSMSNVARNQSVNVGNSIRTGFMGISNIISNQMSNARNQFTSQMMSMSAVARNQANNISNTIRTGFINIYNIINNQSKNARDAFTSQMMSMVAVARNQSTNTANAIRSAFTALPSQMRAIGIQIGNGLANGIASSGARAVAQARSIANQVASTMRGALDIHSPSRVTTEIGEYTGEGLIVGLDNTRRSLMRVVSDMTSDLYSKLQSGVDYNVSTTGSKLSEGSSVNVLVNSKGKNSNDINLDRIIDSLNNKPTVVKVDLDKKNIVTAIAEPIKDYMDMQDVRKSRLGGGR
ncbi:MAG: phage tail tape measure protein [Sarcina sp.]